MGGYLMHEAWEYELRGPARRMVLMWLCYVADDRDGRIVGDMHINELTWSVRCHRSTVERALARLQELGVLVREGDDWRVVLDALPKKPPYVPDDDEEAGVEP